MIQNTVAVKPQITYGAVLGKVIEYRRRQLERTQAPFAAALGMTQSGYSRIEKGQTSLSVLQLQVIASLLDCLSAELLSDADRYASLLRERGAEIVADKKEGSPAGLLIAAGILVALLASS